MPDKLDESLRRMFDLLKLESNRRLVLKWVGEKRLVGNIKSHASKYFYRFISLSNENFQSVLPFASLWAKVDLFTPSSAAFDTHTNSFYSNVVNRYDAFLKSE